MSHRRTFDPQQAKSTPVALSHPGRACRDVDPDTFFPDHASGYHEAVAICHTCPVEDRCLTWAIETVQSFGVYGGTTPDERHFMIKNVRRSAA